MKNLLLLVFTLVSCAVSAQISYTFNYAADPRVRGSEKTVVTKVTVSSNLVNVVINEGGKETRFKTVRLGKALPGEYNFILDTSERLYVCDGYVIYFDKNDVVKRFWTNNKVVIY